MIDENAIPADLPSRERQYLLDTASMVADALGGYLLGLYLMGSASYGEYVAGESDLDLQAVATADIDEATLGTLAERLLHRHHPCPATKLEFVVYAREALSCEDAIAYRLNLNTGPAVADHLSLDAREDPPHWFVLDIAMGRTRAVRLCGAAPAEVFPAIADPAVARAMGQCLAWYRRQQPASAAHLLCICRCCVFVTTGELVSKRRARAVVAESLGPTYVQRPGAMADLEERVIGGLERLSGILPKAQVRSARNHRPKYRALAL